MHRSLLLGFFALAFAQIAISINVVTSKYLLTSMPMFLLLAGRFGVSTILLGIALKTSGTSLADPKHPQGKLNLNDWLLAILQGFFATFLFNFFFVWGLQLTTATAAGIVSSTLPAIIALCALWMLKERLGWTKIFALVLAMLGILVINLEHVEGGTNLNHSYLGDLLIFAAMFPEAWYSIITRKLAGRLTPLGGAFIANVVGFITLLPCALITSPIDLSIYSYWEGGLIIIAGISSLIFFWGWAFGLCLIPASTAAIFGGVMPVATTILAMLFLGESLRWCDLFGMLFVLTSIIIGAGWHPFVRKPKLTQA